MKSTGRYSIELQLVVMENGVPTKLDIDDPNNTDIAFCIGGYPFHYPSIRYLFHLISYDLITAMIFKHDASTDIWQYGYNITLPNSIRNGYLARGYKFIAEVPYAIVEYSSSNS